MLEYYQISKSQVTSVQELQSNSTVHTLETEVTNVWNTTDDVFCTFKIQIKVNNRSMIKHKFSVNNTLYNLCDAEIQAPVLHN